MKSQRLLALHKLRRGLIKDQAKEAEARLQAYADAHGFGPQGSKIPPEHQERYRELRDDAADQRRSASLQVEAIDQDIAQLRKYRKALVVALIQMPRPFQNFTSFTSIDVWSAASGIIDSEPREDEPE